MKIFKKLALSSFVLLFAFAVHSNVAMAQQQQQQQAPQGDTVVDKVQSNDDTSEFAEILKVSGFAEVLKKQGPYTVLAPSNEALESSDIDLESAKNDQEAAQKVAQSHLYQGNLPTEEVESSMGVKVEDSDDSPSNGTIYIVDGTVSQ